jgi:hypothetical protein
MPQTVVRDDAMASLYERRPLMLPRKGAPRTSVHKHDRYSVAAGIAVPDPASRQICKCLDRARDGCLSVRPDTHEGTTEHDKLGPAHQYP